MFNFREYKKYNKTSSYKSRLENELSKTHFLGIINPNSTVITLTIRPIYKQILLYKTESYEELLDLWTKINDDPSKYGRFFTFQPSKEGAMSIATSGRGMLKHYYVIDRTEKSE